MSIHFRILCEVEVNHTYHGGPCPDFEFVVPNGSPALAAGHLLMRTRHRRLLVLYEADDEGNALRQVPGMTLLIGLCVPNPYFTNFTEPAVPDGYVPIYANDGQPRAFDLPLAARIARPSQRIAPALAERPASLKWALLGQQVAQQTLVSGQDDATFLSRDWPVGLYTLTEDAGGPLSVSHWLVHPELAGQGLWGVAAVTIDAGFYTNPPLLSVSLKARRERVKYYVVARNYGVNEFGNLNVNDAGAAEQGRPAVIFDTIGRNQFAADDLPPEVLGDASTRVVLFQSQDELDRRAGGYRKLQLRSNNEVLVQHLPQAGSDRAQARFIVHLAKS